MTNEAGLEFFESVPTVQDVMKSGLDDVQRRAENGTVAQENGAAGAPTRAENAQVGIVASITDTQRQAALDADRRLLSGGIGCELSNVEAVNQHLAALDRLYRAALSAPRVPVIDGLDEAIVKFKHFVLTGESGGAGMTYPIEKAARAYAELQKGV